MKIRPVGSELFNVEGWKDEQTETDTMTLTVAFGNFANAPKNELTYEILRMKQPRETKLLYR